MESSRVILSRITGAYRAALAALLLLAIVPSAPAQGIPPAPPPDLAAPLTNDPAIRVGQLPNGITFYIRQNGRPEDRALLRLAVKSGSIDEDDDQRGLAHVLEHMAFNGTANFKPGELVAYMESIGSRFGAHVNAYTSYDETVYMLEVPTDRDGLLARGMQVLSDFGGGMTLDPAEIEKERGVVLEEWRGRLGVGSRIQTIQEPAIYGDSRYARRLPIGTPEVLRTFTPQRLRDFYDQHYRPDRMGVVVVGDIDPAEAERLVRQAFGGLRARGEAQPRPVYPIPPHDDTRFALATDREAQASTVTVLHKRPLEPLRTVGDYRGLLVQSLAYQMLNARLGEIARRPDAPFLGASTGGDTLGRTVEAFTAFARVNDGGLADGLAALTQEIERVDQFGFGEAELDRAKRGLLAGYERSYNERDKAESGGLTNELVSLFLQGEPAPGIEAEYRMAQQFVPGITAAEAAALFRRWTPDGNTVVLTVAPEKEGLAPVTEVALRDAMRRGETATLTPWEDDIAGRALMASAPEPGTVRSRREIPEIGVTVLTLSNGVEVYLKPTDFKNDQIVFSGYAKGGTSLAGEAEYRDASLSATLVGLSGLGGFTPVDLGKLLAGKIASASAFIGSNTHGVSGSASPRDLETALQLLYLNFTAPNMTAEGFELMQRRLRAAVANQAQNPGTVFGERARCINTMDHYTCRPLTVADVDRLDAGRMAAFYKARFANAADFTFFVAGAFEVEQITPLLAAYVGSLPSTGQATAKMGEVRLQFPRDVIREVVRKGQEPRASTVMSFFADPGLDELEIHRLNAATTLLQVKLRDILREELGGTYSVGVGFSSTLPQPDYGTTTVQFGSAPENVDTLVRSVLTELDRLRKEGPTADDVQRVKETEKRDIETAMRQNNYWLNSMQTVHLYGWDLRRIAARPQRTESLSAENIHAALQKYFPADRYTVITLLPE